MDGSRAHPDGSGGTVDRAAGPRPTRPDAGLFGPQSVTWRVHADPLLGLAALRGLLLQELHPLAPFLIRRLPAVGAGSRLPAVGAGSGANGPCVPAGPLPAPVVELATRSRPGRRPNGPRTPGPTPDPDLRAATAQVLELTTAVTFGSCAHAMLAASRMQAVHQQTCATTADGHPCSAADPQFLAWLHCTQVASFLEICTRGGLRLSGQDQDRYIREQVTTAMLVGLEPPEVPHDRAGLRDYFRAVRPVLECSADARQRAGALLTDADPTAGLAYAALPPWARRLYALDGLTGSPDLGDAAATVALQLLRAHLTGTDERPAPR